MPTITFPVIETQKLGVDEPVLMMAHSDDGDKIVYSITSGTTKVDLVDGSELRPKATGNVTVRAELESDDTVFEEQTFTIEDGDYYERLNAIEVLRNQLDNDGADLLEISKMPVSSINNLYIETAESSAIVEINGTKFIIDSPRHVLKYLQKATEIWRTERTNDEARLDKMITDLKSIDPS
jgi:hypothetical protein